MPKNARNTKATTTPAKQAPTAPKPVAAATGAPTAPAAVATAANTVQPASTTPAPTAAPAKVVLPLYGTTGAAKQANFTAAHNQTMWASIATALAASPAGLTIAQLQSLTNPNMGFANYCIKKCMCLAVQVPAPEPAVAAK